MQKARAVTIPQAKRDWVLLVYKIPSQPTRLRAAIWRKLQRCGAIYLQNAVSLLPATSELAENMQWIADEIAEMGGVAYVFQATSLPPGQEARLVEAFRRAASERYGRLREDLSRMRRGLAGKPSGEEIEELEEEMKRARVALLRLKARTPFPVYDEEEVERLLRQVQGRLERHYLRPRRKDTR